MSRADYTITNEDERKHMLAQLARAPIGDGFSVTAKRAKRSVPQNARLWAQLTQVSREIEWHGSKLAPEDWKLIFMQALGHEMRLAPNIAGNGFVSLGGRSSELTKQEFSDLMELITAFAAERGVIIKNPKEDAADETEGGAVPQPASDPPSVREPAHPGELIRTREGAMEYARRWGAYYLSLPKDREEEFIIETEATVKIAIGLNPTAQDPISDALNAPKEIVA